MMSKRELFNAKEQKIKAKNPETMGYWKTAKRSAVSKRCAWYILDSHQKTLII